VQAECIAPRAVPVKLFLPFHQIGSAAVFLDEFADTIAASWGTDNFLLSPGTLVATGAASDTEILLGCGGPKNGPMPVVDQTVELQESAPRTLAGDHANRRLVRFQRGCHGSAPGDR
jgi:hypothetical protein